MKIRSSFLSVVLIAASCLGCSDSSSVDVNRSGTVQELFPLKIGNAWLYTVDGFDTSGNVTDHTTQEIELTSSRLYRGHEVFQVLFNGDTTEGDLIYYDGTGVFSFTNADDTVGRQIIHSPMTAGESVTLQTHSATPHIFTLREANILVRVSSGLFRCFHFEDSASSVSHLWFCKDVGLVKEEDYDYSNGKRYLAYRTELADFVIK